MNTLDNLFSEYGERAYIHAKRTYIPQFMSEQNRQVADAAEEVLPKGGTVIYPGCGTGIVLQLLIEHDPSLLAIGFDIAEGMIRKAIETTDQKIKYFTGDAHSPPERYNSVADAVLLKNSLYFLDPEVAIPMIGKLLKPQGHLILTTFKSLDPGTLKDRLWQRAIYDTKTRPAEEFMRGDISEEQLREVTGSVDAEIFYQTQLLPFIRPPLPLGGLAEILHANSFAGMEILDMGHYADTMYLVRAQKK
ncbi:MAG: class I SAM-dependent methyltransferase [Nanoarchaeota archaeon]|nr:class I SAM-dependent methyltransferase [Nanoarchaeota archaeon]